MSLARRIALGLAVLGLVLLVLGYTQLYRPTREAVAIGAGYLAKQVCSCVFIARRSVQECRDDQFATTDPIRIEILDPPGRVRAFVPLLGARTALYREGLGCMLEE